MEAKFMRRLPFLGSLFLPGHSYYMTTIIEIFCLVEPGGCFVIFKEVCRGRSS